MIRSGRTEEGDICYVSDFIDDDTLMWNQNLIVETFSSFEAREILKIPLSRQVQDDHFCWGAILDGLYTMKSSYGFLTVLDDNSASNSTSSAIFPCSQIWKVDSIPRSREIVWRACKDILPIKTNLIKRNVVDNVICPCCEAEDEIVKHVFLQCPTVVIIWFASSLSFRIDAEAISSFKDWIAKFLTKQYKSVTPIVFSIIWAIWQRRNTCTFDKVLWNAD